MVQMVAGSTVSLKPIERPTTSDAPSSLGGGIDMDYGVNFGLSAGPSSMSFAARGFHGILEGLFRYAGRQSVPHGAVSRRIRDCPESWGTTSRETSRLQLELTPKHWKKGAVLDRRDMLVRPGCAPKYDLEQEIKRDAEGAFSMAPPDAQAAVQECIRRFRGCSGQFLSTMNGILQRQDGSSVVDVVPSAWLSNNLSSAIEIGTCTSMEGHVLARYPQLANYWRGPVERSVVQPGATFKFKFDCGSRPVVWFRFSESAGTTAAMGSLGSSAAAAAAAGTAVPALSAAA